MVADCSQPLFKKLDIHTGEPSPKSNGHQRWFAAHGNDVAAIWTPFVISTLG